MSEINSNEVFPNLNFRFTWRFEPGRVQNKIGLR
jgi:hypothetical protein